MRRGSITVFLAMLLTVVLFLTLTLLESVRATGVKLVAREAGDAATDSVFAGYDRELLDDYGLLFYDGGMGRGLIQYDGIEAEFEEVFKDNTHAGLKLLGGSFFPVKSVDSEITEVVTATDYNGEIFIRSVLDYYKFAGAADLLASIQADIQTEQAGESQWAQILRGETVPSYEELFGTETEEGGEDSGGGFSSADKRKYEKGINESPIGGRKEREKKGWMGLVIPSGRAISGKKTNQLNFPSRDGRDDRELSDGNLLLQGTQKVVFNEYLLEYFPNFTDQNNGELEYELEYILFGKKTDEENLKSTLNRLLWLREGMNLLCILSSPTLMNDAESMAMMLVGWTEIEVLVPIVETALIAAWSYAESLADLRILLSGGMVPMLKSQKTWNLDLTGVVDFLRGDSTELKKDQNGLAYEGYLRLLLFLTDINDLSYRAMDMVQMNRQREDSSFLMMSQIYALEIKTSIQAKPLFFRLPVFYKTARKWMTNYEWEEYFTQTY